MSEETQILTRWVDPTIDDFKIALEEANKQIEEDNKEIERLHQCIKDDKENADEIISEQAKEIERLQKDNFTDETLDRLFIQTKIMLETYKELEGKE